MKKPIFYYINIKLWCKTDHHLDYLVSNTVRNRIVGVFNSMIKRSETAIAIKIEMTR